MAVRALSDIERTTLIPAKKLLALEQLSAQVLKTRDDEYDRIDRGIRGREADQAKTFGDLRDEEDLYIFTDGVRKAGLDNDIGSKQKKAWATVVGLITPDLAVCEKCNKYPIAYTSGVVSPPLDERCPHCGKGLITAPKQEAPYQAWTTLEMVSPGKSHDRQTIQHLPLPLSNSSIEADAGTFYQIGTEVRAALVQEGLTLDGKPDFGRFLAYLAHGPLANRFQGLDQVLRALGSPDSFGAYDLVSIRSLVRKAKVWTPSAITSVHKEESFSSSEQPMSLDQLLCDLFSVDGLQRFCSQNCPGMVSQLSWGNSLNQVAFEAANCMKAFGYNNDKLVEALIRERPGKKSLIEASRQLILSR
ncbi:hypothetical protein HQ487_00775 [Candidatus Uhrbacteria bacterium]|nr:hypothetical protein [Candidatus Uhrbacteria bacterium]